MQRLMSIAAAVGALVSAIAASAGATAVPPVVGVNLVNEPYKQTPAEQEATFRALQEAGVHVIRDQAFPSVVMYVVVDANAVEYDFPDREGTFQMNLPPGDYTLKAFFEGKPTGKPIDGVKVEGKGIELKEPLAVGGDSK